jgi:hypothetical protein
MAGRKRLFTERDIAALIEELPCPSALRRQIAKLDDPGGAMRNLLCRNCGNG